MDTLILLHVLTFFFLTLNFLFCFGIKLIDDIVVVSDE